MSVADIYRNRGVNPLAVTKTITLGTNLVVNPTFEVNVLSWSGGGTITRDTAAPLVGVGSLKMASVDAANMYVYQQFTTLVVGHLYLWGGLVKSTAAVGRTVSALITTGGIANQNYDCSAAATDVWMTFAATATEAYPVFQLNGYTAGDYLLLDSAYLYDLGA
jgi:hypothetical protein